jgi:hypothetical protein
MWCYNVVEYLCLLINELTVHTSSKCTEYLRAYPYSNLWELRTHDAHRLTHQNESKNMENG